MDEAKLEEYLNGWKRAKADLINYQKDEAKRFEELAKFANVGIVKELIAVLDSFDLGSSQDQGSCEDLKLGWSAIKSQLESVLKRNGLEKIAVEVGKPFDANFQEAIAEAESDQPVGNIIEVVATGYTFNGRVIRPARVKISRGK